MANVFARSGEKAISLFRKHIFRTQIALSLFYFCIVAGVLIVSSQITRSIFVGRVAIRFNERIEEGTTLIFPRGPNAADVQQDLRDSMFVVNIAFLMLASVLGYFLAGITLKPLSDAYEKEQRFLNDASHELRTPLAILRTSLENIAYKGGTMISNDTQDALEEVDRMHHLLENILTLSRAKQYTLQKEVLSCNEFGKSIINRVQSLAEKHHCIISFLPSEKEVAVFADKESLERALLNLIHNAFAYNKPNGTVTLAIKKEGSRAVFTVSDTGSGMTKEELEHITERFYRPEKSRTRSQGGSGLGLAIVDQIVKDHKGMLTFSSILGKGTTASITLPVHKAS